MHYKNNLNMETKELYKGLIKFLRLLKEEPDSSVFKSEVEKYKQLILLKVASESKEDFVSHLMGLGLGAIGYKVAYLNSDEEELKEAREEYFNAIEVVEGKFPNSIAKMTMDAMGFRVE